MRSAGIPEPAEKTAAVAASAPPERGPAEEAAVDARAPADEDAGSRPVTGRPARGHKRGRPRSKRADSAILHAAADLLAERGLGGMSIEEVASRAGVGKATIYRRWPSRGTLVLDAFLAELLGQQPLPDTGTLRGDLLTALRGWITSVTQTSAGPMLTGLIAEAQQDRALGAAWRDRVVDPLRAQYTIMLDRAVSRGEIPADTDKDVVFDLLYGAAYHRLLHKHRPLTDHFARRVVDLIVAGLSANLPALDRPAMDWPSSATASQRETRQ